MSGIPWKANTSPSGPAFYRGFFVLNQVKDTFLELPGWTKGFAVINGFNLGRFSCTFISISLPLPILLANGRRYWNIGPQQSLYVPSSVLRTGENEIIVFELHQPNALKYVTFTSYARYGKA